MLGRREEQQGNSLCRGLNLQYTKMSQQLYGVMYALDPISHASVFVFRASIR